MTRQKGVALITVLLLVALVTAICAGLLLRQQLAIASTAQQLSARQALHYALGAEALTQGLLKQLWEREGNQPPVVHLNQSWAKSLPVFSVEQGQLAIRVSDLAGRFNLNSLVSKGQSDALALERFRRLLRALELNPAYAERLRDWQDADNQSSDALGAEDDAYLRLAPPYRAANRPLASVSELRLLLDMSEADYQKLAPWVAALPPGTALNVNTASPLVLSCLAEGLTLAQAQQLRSAGGAQGYRQINDFTRQPLLASKQLSSAGLAVSSDYFLVHSEVRQGTQRLVLESALQREPKHRMRVLWRDLGAQAALPDAALAQPVESP